MTYGIVFIYFTPDIPAQICTYAKLQSWLLADKHMINEL